MKLSVCMIVKNEEQMLAKTLPGLKNYVDEIVLVDTGSTDGTIELAKKHGAHVYRFTWINDFAAARNYSLQQASGDWIVWLDADEYLNEAELNKLRSVLEASQAKALSVNIYESKIGECEKSAGYPRVKVFKNNLGYKFVRPINEQLIDCQNRFLFGELVDVSIFHWGKYLEQERLIKKREGYIRLYSEAIKQTPNDPHYHYLLANNYLELERTEEALKHYLTAYQLAGKVDIGRMALERIADIYLTTKRLPAAGQAAQELLAIDPQSIRARNIYASLLIVAGKTDLAIAILREALDIKIDGRVENIYETTARPNFLLGKAYQIKGEMELAQACLAKASAIAPSLGS